MVILSFIVCNNLMTNINIVQWSMVKWSNRGFSGSLRELETFASQCRVSAYNVTYCQAGTLFKEETTKKNVKAKAVELKYA